MRKLSFLALILGIFLVVFIFVGAGNVVFASTDTYYVAPSVNDANPGTLAQPWRAIQHAADTLQVGQTVYIREASPGYTFLEVPDPLSGDNPTYPLIPRDVPIIGESFEDHHFGTTLTRVTQIDGTNGRHEYSRFDPFNVDQSMIVLTIEGYWRVYRTQKMPYNQSDNIVTTLIDLEDPRWDLIDPDLI